MFRMGIACRGAAICRGQASLLSGHLVKRYASVNTTTNSSLFTKHELIKARTERNAGLGPIISKLPQKLIPYAELMRLEKPAGTHLLYLPCTFSTLIAAAATMAPITSVVSALGLMGIGSVIMRGAGCTINDLSDRKMDAKVLRSVERPLASQRVSIPAARRFLALQTFAGMGVLALLPSQTWGLAMMSLPIVAIYPLCKRFTYYPQFVLGACFKWGALLGYASLGLPTNWSVVLPLYAGSWAWCVAYDTIYAHQDKKFDIKAGVKSTALAWGKNTKKICTGLAVFQTGMFALAGFNTAMIGPGFVTGLGILTYRFFRMIQNVDLDNVDDCDKHFKENITSGYYFTGGLVFDYLLRLLGLF